MNILHISDLHFGPRHWDGNDQLLLEKINSFDADIVINTGDNTTDGLESEYAQAGNFLKEIRCENIISTLGNHDKRNMRSHELFHEYIDDSKIITISKKIKTSKKHLFLNLEITKLNDHFTDINFVKSIEIKGKKVLVISIDSNELYNDDGYVEEKVLNAVTKSIKQEKYDIPLLLTHYSVLGTDECPLKNSATLIDFVQKHKIKHVFCGHTHELELMRTNDLYYGHQFDQYMCGTLSSRNHPKDDNMFLYYENLGTNDMHLYVIRVFPHGDILNFKEEKVF
ncbi:metallophosphoesterase [Labilibaculum sp. K2S]|uniref:metallophosphoesterase family protein n=1 Tax=Labilibaculum sp. K2S TaxID=3056386 RepID=UPI0025A41905|nr:metallophosphoesterase [Labilibaculum sp. K2S]MDM8162052.1 metallophosphoesterase [Labilibaculum sp. K2S]